MARQTDLVSMMSGLLVLTAGACLEGTLPPDSWTFLGAGVGGALGLALAWAAGVGGDPERRLRAGIQNDTAGHPKAFTLSHGQDWISLDPGRNWTAVDHYKWVTRGIIEPPQSYHVLPDGTVELNDDKIRLRDPGALEKLEHEINKRHLAAPAAKPAAAQAAARAAAPPPSDRVLFKVKVDHLSHFLITAIRGEEKVETGLRGLGGLILHGMLLKPAALHVDPLQRGVELDGVKYECGEAGARELERVLNARYAPAIAGTHEHAIEVRENPASATGFDLRFVSLHAGARFEFKGHFSQDNLDILQDPARCELLQPGIVLRLSPPLLLVRRKRSDGGEERLPEFPDLQYRRATAAQLQELLNDPLIRRTAGQAAHRGPAAVETRPDLVELRVTRNPQNKLSLWLEEVTAAGGRPEGVALSHHNIADLQHRGVFLPHLDVALSLDHIKLSVIDTRTRHEETVHLGVEAKDEDLQRASALLTVALRPPRPLPAPTAPEAAPAARPAPEAASPAPPTPAPPAPAPPVVPPPIAAPEEPGPPAPASAIAAAAQPPRTAAGAFPPRIEPADSPPPPALASAGVPPKVTQAPPPRSAAPVPPVDPWVALFRETDAVTVNTRIFWRLSGQLGMAAQDVLLSLPRVFENRRFEILSFSHPQIEDVLELRGEAFYGFYLSHVKERKILLVYACQGRHLEFGPDRCLAQAAPQAEASEHRGSGLLGLAQNADNHFVFVVEPGCRQWLKPYEKNFAEAFAHFLTPAEFAQHPEAYALVWPQASEAPPA